MENTRGVQPASTGMNFSAAPAAPIWWDMCPIGAQQFQGSANETLPTQTQETLAEVLEEIGIGTTNSSRKVVDFKAFMASRGDRPIYTRVMLRNAANQLPLLGKGKAITLTTCYDRPVVLNPKSACPPRAVPIVKYRGPHQLAVYSQDEMAKHWALLPVYVECAKKVTEPSDDEYATMMYHQTGHQALWFDTKTRSIFLKALEKFEHTAPISNIVCIGMGTLHGNGLESTLSMVKHIVATTLAEELTRLYKKNGVPLKKPITIIAQDSTYTKRDRELLSGLTVPIQTVADPEGFLAIDESSLVFSNYVGDPVKHLIADLATEAPHGKGPAALFLNKDNSLDDVDLIRCDPDHPITHNNPETRAYATMLKSYAQVIDGAELFGVEGIPIRAYHQWLAEMNMWTRED